jgi:threonine dehydrogenase-like Zn-dependent dehydrogenase
VRAIIYNGHEAVFTTDHPLPQPQADESLVQVELAALCNTDREILRGYRPDFCGILGHEFVGIVRTSPQAALKGARVVGEINLNCGRCHYCTTGRPHHCSHRTTLGINGKNGAFADYLTLPTRLLHVVEKDGAESSTTSLAPEEAVFCEPLAAALRITEQLDLPARLPVAIVGDGRLALMICQALAATTSAALTVIGRHPEKLELFAPYARTLCVPKDEQPERQEGFGEPEPQSFEVVIDASGSPSSLAFSLALTRSEGTLVMKSTYAGEAAINMSEVVVRELRILGSRCGSFAPALRLLREGRVSLPPIELFAPEDYEAAFRSPAFKAALDFR